MINAGSIHLNNKSAGLSHIDWNTVLFKRVRVLGMNHSDFYTVFLNSSAYVHAYSINTFVSKPSGKFV